MKYCLKRRFGYPRPELHGHNTSVQANTGNGCTPDSMSSPIIKSQSDHVIRESSEAEIWCWGAANSFSEGGAIALGTPRRMGLSGILDQLTEKSGVFLLRYYKIILPTLIGINLASLVMLMMCIQCQITCIERQIADLKMEISNTANMLADLKIIMKEMENMEQHGLSSNMSVSGDDVIKKLMQLVLDGKLKTCYVMKCVSKVKDMELGDGDVMLLGYPKTDMRGVSHNDSSLQKPEVDSRLFHESHFISLHDTRM